MADPVWAVPADVRSRWVGSDPPPADEVIAGWLADAATVIEAAFPTLPARLAVDADGQLHRRVVFVQCQLVMQALKNPDGVRQASTTTGPFSEQLTYGTETLSQAMALTPVHRQMLAENGTQRAYSVDTTPRPASAAHPLLGAWVNGPAGLAPGESP